MMTIFNLRFLPVLFWFLSCVFGFLLLKEQGTVGEEEELSKAILEMLHIERFSTPYQAKPHPYMRQVYQLLDAHEVRDLGKSDGTLVQSFRSVPGPECAPPGWIWFNVSHLKPSMTVAELVLLRKTLHPDPLSVTVALHSLVSWEEEDVTGSAALEERLLTLNQLPPSGYDVFNVSAVLAEKLQEVVGFQLRYKDESGSLVLHEALTQSFYCLAAGSSSQPLLVTYQARPLRPQAIMGSGLPVVRRQHQSCRTGGRDRKHHRRRASPDSPCSLHQRYVDFREGVLGRWILQPSGFNASFCRGSCNKWAGTSKQSSVKSLTCASKEFSSVAVMQKTETDEVLIKTLRNTKAKSCVCL